MADTIKDTRDNNELTEEINLIVHNEVVKGQDWTIGELTSELTQRMYEWHIEKSDQALAEIKRIITSNKPSRVFTTDLKGSRHAKVYSMALDDYEDSLIKALG